MNPFTYLWMRYKASGWHQFHREMLRGFKASTIKDKLFDAALFLTGAFVLFLDYRAPVHIGYFILVLLVLGQGWINSTYRTELKTMNKAFLTALHMLHEERVRNRELENADSGS